MKILSHKLPWPKHANTIEILACSCSHYGNPGFDADAHSLFIERAKKQPWVHHGDSIESILPGDKRHNVDEHKATVLDQAMEYADLIAPAAKTCIGMNMGNHEYSVSKLIGNISLLISKQAGIPYLGYSARVDLLSPSGICRAFFAHGARNNTARAGDPELRTTRREINLRKLFEPYDADLCGCGHFHRHIVTPAVDVEKIGAVNGKMEFVPKPFDNKWHYSAPSFFKGYEEGDMPSYGELFMYGPTHIGWIGIIMNRDGTIAAIREYYGSGKQRNEYTRRTMI
jgi:hypothetical protein